jgi:hypothetical protein
MAKELRARECRRKRVNRQDAEVAKHWVRVEPSVELDGLAHRVIGAASRCMAFLGPGFLESVNEEALCVELTLPAFSLADKYRSARNIRDKGLGTHGWIF